MNNFKSGGPGGLRKRPEFMGGRPKSDANYGAKKSFDKKPFGGDRGGSRGGFGGGDRGGRGGDRGGFGGQRDGDRRPVEMHKATCSTCSKPCEVPFRPDGSKPVLCSECFGKNRSDDRNGVERRDRFDRNDRPQRAPERKFDAPAAPRGPSPDIKALQLQVSTLEAKLNEVLYILKGSSPVKKATKFEKTENVIIPAGEVVTVVSDIKKAPKVAAPMKEVAPKTAAKKAPTKKVAVKKAAPKKVVKKVAKKK
jgi:CxxC-x17-CxxC domain-containing protein